MFVCVYDSNKYIINIVILVTRNELSLFTKNKVTVCDFPFLIYIYYALQNIVQRYTVTMFAVSALIELNKTKRFFDTNYILEDTN